MPSWLQMVFANAVSATLLALVVALVAPRLRRPAVAHVLWLLVLVELVAPPVLELDVLPKAESLQKAWAMVDRPGQRQGPSRQLAAGDLATLSAPEPSGAAPSSSPLAMAGEERAAGRGDSVAWVTVLLALFASGTVVLLAAASVRLVRFRRFLRHAVDAPDALQQRLVRLARQWGIRRAPRLRLVPGRMPPALWLAPRSHEILLPAELLPRLDDDETDALLAHELAHLQRRDQWLRPFELVVLALYWWHPVAWWARRNLRRAEEESCDAMVLRTLRARPRVYAESLLKTVEFLAFRHPAVPSLATGATGAAPLKERVIMILQARTPHSMPRTLRTPLVLAVALVVLVSPTWVERAAGVGPKDPGVTERESIEHKHQQELLEIQRQEVQLHREMQRLEQERLVVQRRIDEKRLQQQLEQMTAELEILEQQGQQAEAQQLRNAMATMKREAQLQRQSSEFEQAMMHKRMQIETQLQDLAIEIQSVELAGELGKYEELVKRNFELERQLRRLDIEAMQNQLELQRRRLKNEAQQLDEMQ